jgi:hypothetical protein
VANQDTNENGAESLINKATDEGLDETIKSEESSLIDAETMFKKK